MAWAWREGVEGRDFRETRDRAAGVGTLAHALVEHQWRKPGEPFDWGPYTGSDGVAPTVPYSHEDIEKAKKAFGAYEEWARQTNLRVVEGELPLVSEKYKFGGTMDMILLGGKRAVGDVKTSSGIYEDYLCQIAAYGLLWEENFPDQPIDGGFHILRFDKQWGDFEHRFFADLTEAAEAFKLMVPLYQMMTNLSKRTR